MWTPNMPISPSPQITLEIAVRVGSSMPWKLRNDQYWMPMMIRSAIPKKIGIFIM